MIKVINTVVISKYFKYESKNTRKIHKLKDVCPKSHTDFSY